KVIGTASDSTADFLQDLGAEQISYGPGLADRLKNKEITAAIDLFSHETLKAALELGVKADKMSTVIMYPEPPAGIPTATGGEALPSDME
ncbi:NADP-dependent oxidoreductase, partial [Lacticaseibacillus paracasei]